MHWSDIPEDCLEILQAGTVIPAHPLALNESRKLDVARQRALSRYYLDAGAGGLAVGVHTTQFAIREAGLYEPVLQLAAQTVEGWTEDPVFLIAGLIGKTTQALREAETARELGYHAGLLSLSAFKGASEDDIIAHCAEVAEEIPLMGFYLQEAVGGIRLSAAFWRRFAEIDNVVAIKIAPFNRYATLDVVRGVVAAEAEDRISLYTGNDDNIVLDLAAPFTVMRGDEPVSVPIVGGLLGHWSVWTRMAVATFELIADQAERGKIEEDVLALHAQVTDCNAAFFDVANDFKGCIAGCHEVLRRQGLLEGIWCLDESDGLSPGQSAEIDRVCAAYPHLNDDEFVAENLAGWLA